MNARAIDVTDGLTHGRCHVRALVKHQLHESGSLDTLALDVIDSGDVQEVILVVVREEPFHLRGIHAAVRLSHIDGGVTDLGKSAARNNKEDFLLYGRRYVQLLTEHIEKENYVLFDMADQALTDDEDQKVAEAFDHFDKTIVGTSTYERVHSIFEKLASKYLGAAVH